MASETDDVRVWLVERGYDNRDLVVLESTTREGDEPYRRELAAQAIGRSSVTAVKDVAVDDLEAVDEPERRER